MANRRNIFTSCQDVPDDAEPFVFDELFSTVPLHFWPIPRKVDTRYKTLVYFLPVGWTMSRGIMDYAESDGGLPVSSGIGFATGETGVASGA